MPFRSDRISVLSFDSFLDNWYHLKKQKQSCGIEGLCPFVLNALHPTNLRQKNKRWIAKRVGRNLFLCLSWRSFARKNWSFQPGSALAGSVENKFNQPKHQKEWFFESLSKETLIPAGQAAFHKKCPELQPEYNVSRKKKTEQSEFWSSKPGVLFEQRNENAKLLLGDL